MQIDIEAAGAELALLVDRVATGEEVVITRPGRPVARLLAAEPAKRERRLGLLEGQGFWVADDFDAPLPDDLLDLFEGERTS